VEGYYIAAGVLVAWALIVTIIGVRVENFPATPGMTRLVAAVSIVLVATTIGLAIYLSATEEHDDKGGEKHAAAQRI
jgi:phosphate/sulfate permease